MARPEPAAARQMPSACYLRPIQLCSGGEAARLVDDGLALPLAGGPLAFAAAEILTRQDSGGYAARMVAVPQLAAAVPASLLTAMTMPRPPLPGLPAGRPLVMGIINVTPDSFSDGGLCATAEAAAAHGAQLAEAGADLLDIGGESTRPGADPVPPAVECDRVLPVIERLRPLGLPLSVDTRNAEVMRGALAAGCCMVNDVSALGHDPQSLEVVAGSDAAVVLMHARGDPKTMQQAPRYDAVELDVHDHLAARLAACAAAGIERHRIVVDPGIGFGKTALHNLALLRSLSLLHGLGCRLLVGASRKSFIGRFARGEPADRRLGGSLAVALHALGQGAQLLRVHDVAETVQAVSLWRRLCDGRADADAGG